MAKRNTRTGAGKRAPLPPSVPSSGSCKSEGASSVVETITTTTSYYCSALSVAPMTGSGRSLFLRRQHVRSSRANHMLKGGWEACWQE